jgi:prevent-host-death family protein
MKSVAMEEFRENAQNLVSRCRRMTEPIVITEFGEEVARLIPRRQSWREWLQGAFGLFHMGKKRTRKYAYWGVFLKMR